MTDSTTTQTVPAVPPGTPLRRTLRWAGRHPFRALLLLLAAFLVYEVATIPWFSVAQLAVLNPQETALMRQRASEAAGGKQPYRIVHRWLPLKRMPRQLVEAVVVAEDGTFYSHGGFDWYEVRASLERNFRERRFARGGSTITQQLAKNLYLSTSKDPLRKAKEAVITLLLEQYLTKDRILELYLNVIEWGRGVYGVEAAAQTYFGKSATGLSSAQCLRLAAVIPSPLKHRPDADSRYVLRRAAIVERRLAARARGVIDTTPEEDEPNPDPTSPDGASSDAAIDSSATDAD